MRMGLGLGISRQQRAAGGAPAFSPASLFTGTDTGFWAPVTPSRLWQDVARTTPVTATGQTVASWELTTRTGVIYAEQATAGDRFTYEVDTNGRAFLLGNSSTRFMATPSLTGGPNYQAFAAVHPLSVATTAHVIDADTIAPPRWGQFLRVGAGGAVQSIAFSGTTAIFDAGPTISAGANSVISAIARSADSVDVRANGVSNGATASGLTFNTETQSVRIGRQVGSAGTYFDGRIYGVVLRFGSNLTTQQITDTEAWLAALMNP